MVEGLTVEELARLKALAEKATPGRWSDFDSKAYAGDPDDGDAYVFITTADGCTGEIAAHMLDADARFVAASDPPTTLRLISQVERLTAERESFEAGYINDAVRIKGLTQRAEVAEARADTLAAENARLLVWIGKHAATCPAALSSEEQAS